MSFDLNIGNYTIKELSDMFDLPPNYDNDMIDVKESKLKDSIANDRSITNEVQAKTLYFINQAKSMLKEANASIKENVKNFVVSSFELKPTPTTIDTMVQKRPDKPYLSSYPSEFFKGVINPLKKRTTRKNLNIDTRFRENYYGSPSTNFNMTLPMNFNDVLSMQLAAAEIPTTFYNVSKQSGNNFFSVTATGAATGTVTQMVSLPSGSYKYGGIAAIINERISLLDASCSDIVFEINASAGNGSGQMMVGLKPGSSVTSFSLDFQTDKSGNEDRNTPLPLKLGWMLGFRNGKYEGNLNYVSEGIVDVGGPRYMYLAIDDHNNNVNNGFFSAFNSSLLNKNVLARISLQNASSFGVFSENNFNLVTSPRDYFGPVNLQHLNIQLLDEYGRVVDLNNMDFSFCLTLITAYDI
jgi:hypothetical protein